MPRFTRLEASQTATLTGANNSVTLLHGLQLHGTPVAPTQASFEIVDSQENSGPARATMTATLAVNLVPNVADRVQIGTEIWTWAASRTTPFTVARDALSNANCRLNLIAAINADSIQNLVADLNGGVLRLRGARAPGGAVENGPRTGTLALPTNVAGLAAWSQADMNLCGGAGETTGSPVASEIVRNDAMVRWIVRGMRSTDSLTVRVSAKYTPTTNLAVPTLVSGADGVMVLGSNTFTSAGGAFIANGVQVGDILHVSDVGTPACNGRYRITAVPTATTLTLSTLDLPVGAKASQAALDYVIGPAAIVTDHYANLNQVAFSEPSADTTGPASEALVMALPAGAITLAELNLDVVQDAGRLGTGYVWFRASSNVGDNIVINGTETWTASNGGAGAGEYDQSGGTAAACTASFVAKVNALAGSLVRAIDAGGNVAVLFSKTTAAGNYSLASNAAAGGRISLSNPTGAANTSPGAMANLRAAADIKRCTGGYTVTAQDVATWLDSATTEIALGAIPGAGQPILESFFLRDSNGVTKAVNTLILNFRQSGANEWALCIADPVAVCAATDIIRFSCSVQ